MWRVGRSEPHDQVNAVFETMPDLAEALGRLAVLKRERPTTYVWASGDVFDVAVRQLETGEIGFVVCPTTETDSEPPASCYPYGTGELLKLAAAEAAVVPADEECPTCGQRCRGRYANRSTNGGPFFLCSTCEQWTETLPTTTKPGRRSRRSSLAE